MLTNRLTRGWMFVVSTLILVVVAAGCGSSGTGSGNNGGTTSATPALAVSVTHSGNFSQGQRNATYTVTVSNAAGTAATSGTVTATDTLPSGVTLVSLAGTGWTCTAAACTRSDALASGASYPAITATVNVATLATSPQVNSVAVTGGGSANVTATDSTTITAVTASLSITKSHIGNFLQGQSGAAYTITVTNTAIGGSTSGLVTVTDTLPPGLTLVSLAGTGWSCTAATCTRSDALAATTSYPALTATVNVGPTATSPQVNSVTVSGGASLNATATDSTIITAVPLLSITKSHQGTFTQGQSNVTYTLTVSNTLGTAATSGLVTVTDNPPAGLTVVSLAGTGWTCASNSCTRSDALLPGASYPAITATVNVGSAATSPQINSVSVSGGGSVTATATDPATVIPSNSTCANSSTGNESALHGQYAFLLQGFTGSDNLSPVALVASFTADGNGNITGGEEDFNSLAPQHLTITPTGGFYTVGPDNRGCLTLNYSGGTLTTAAFRFGLGSFASGVATQGRIIEFDDTSGSDLGTRGSGAMRLQTTSAFSLGRLQPRYAFGADGGDFTGSHFAAAGSFNLNTTTGAVTNGSVDTNDGGNNISSTAATGTFAAISATTGRGQFTLNVNFTSTVHLAAYIVNPSQWFVVQTDQFNNSNPISSGWVIVTPSSYTSASISGNQIFHSTGRFSSGDPDINLGIMSFAPASGTSGTSSGALQTYDGTNSGTLNISGQTYTVDASTGRVALSDNPTGTQPRIMYLTTATNGVTAFVMGTDRDALFGFADFQPAATYSVNSLSGNSVFAKEEVASSFTANFAGTTSIVSPGNASFVQDTSDGGLSIAFPFTTNIVVNPDGTGTESDPVAMTTFIMVTNGTKRFFFNPSGPASIRIVEP